MKVLNLSDSMISFATGNGLRTIQPNNMIEIEMTAQFMNSTLSPLINLSPGDIFVSLTGQEEMMLKGRVLTPTEAMITDEEIEKKYSEALAGAVEEIKAEEEVKQEVFEEEMSQLSGKDLEKVEDLKNEEPEEVPTEDTKKPAPKSKDKDTKKSKPKSKAVEPSEVESSEEEETK